MRCVTYSTLSHYWMILISLLLFIRVDLIAAWTTDTNNGDLQHEVNVCLNQEEFRCPDSHVIHVQQVTCGGGSKDGSCVSSSNQTVSDVCQGHQTCSNIGLHSLFAANCDSQAQSGLIARFKCIPGTTAMCRSNICAPESKGLICSPGNTLHIRRVTCSGGNRKECSWNSYNLLASLCEGSVQCDASGLRALLSSQCGSSSDQGPNGQVLVEYVCVPAKLVHNSCSSYRYRPISARFGVLRQPKSTKSDFNIGNNNKNKKCKWVIASPKNNQPIHLNVLFVQSKTASTKNDVCDQKFLRVQSVDCKEQKVVLSSFCNLQGSSLHLESCGPIKIMSSVSGRGDAGNEFIISFQSFPDSEADGFLSSGLSACVAPPPPTHIPRVLTLPSKPADRSQNALKDPAPKDLDTESDNHSGSFRLTLKMLLVYIFLGVLILILIAALITVLVRYHRISLPKNKFADSSENVILWKRYDDTALDVFQQNSLAEPVEPIGLNHTGPHSDKVIATIHHDPVPEHEEVDNRVSTGSGFSSFLPPKRDSGFRDFLDSYQLNSFQSHNNTNNQNGGIEGKSRSVSRYDYHELPENGGFNRNGYNNQFDDDDDDDAQFGGHYSNPNSLSRPPKNLLSGQGEGSGEQHLVAVEDNQPLVIPEIHPKDDYHYCVNNDEYAMVNKSPRKPAINGGGRYNHPGNKMNTRPKGADGASSGKRSVDFCPTTGPYNNKTNSYNNHHVPSNPSYRKSREAMWRDEV